MSVECQVNVKSQSELDIGGRETCYHHYHHHYHHLVGGGVHTLGLVVLGDRGGETHPVVVRDLEQENMSVWWPEV